MCLAIVLNICPMNPPGVQFAMAIIPPGRHTRVSSAATSSGRGANIAPIKLTTASNWASSIRQRFGISFFERDLQSLGGRAGTGFLEPVGRDVATGDLCARPGRDQRELPGAAADIEQPGSRCDSEPPEKLLRVLLHIAGESVVVSGHPCRLQASLEFVNFCCLSVFLSQSRSCVSPSILSFWIRARCVQLYDAAERLEYLIDRPVFFAANAEFSEAMKMDVLSEVLRVVRLEGALFFNGEFSAPWCISEPRSTAIVPYLSPRRGT